MKKLLATLAILAAPTFGQILPETITPVDMSNQGINRVVCTSGEINDVYFSEEKGVIVTIDKNQALIKFLIASNGQSETYVTAESEFYVVCAGTTYTLIATPLPIEPKTYRLGDPYGERKEKLSSIFTPMTLEERAIKATHMVFKGDGDLLRKITGELKFERKDLVPDAIVSTADVYKVDGFGLVVREFRVTAKENISSLQEIQFLHPIYSKNIIAITVAPHSIEKGQIARVFVVEHEANKQ